jgi:maltose alpha-D-glucosyltransferase / alpha-amylase
MSRRESNQLPEEPLWYKDAIFYELRVRSFYDSSGDGIGDFPGLTEKLDYLQRLGITALWLLPFYPSPLRDDGYDISDYMGIHPHCGTLHDFKVFLRQAHERGLRVVTELVLNHTSDQHPWFQRARRAPPGSRERDFYIWNDNADRYRGARIIFRDFEPSNWSWDPVAKAYYFHRFYAHQPDLNYDNPAVRAAVLRVVDFWLGLGVDGLRLDAVPYLYKREGTNCENLPETHAFLRDLRRHVDGKFRDRMLLAEANQWPEDAVAYLAQGKECHMAFHFPLMPRMFMAVRMEDRFPITDVWAQTPEIDEICQWALFLRNHDELTLEMVTEEEREYMYRAYAQESRMRLNLGIRRRLATLLGNNRRAIELNYGLLFSLPGTPVIYYGDEIGMGDNVYLGDRDGVRTPMQWSGDRNAGFSKAEPQRLILPVIIDHEYHYQTVNVEAHEANRHSLLWWVRRLIALRNQFKAFGRGTMEFLSPENPRILAFTRSYKDEKILVVANLSRFPQYVELDLSEFKGMVPVELFGRTEFPVIMDHPYVLTLGPHNFDWFSLESPRRHGYSVISDYQMPKVEIESSAQGFLQDKVRANLERILPSYLPHCRWFRGKAQNLKSVRMTDAFAMADESHPSYLILLEAAYASGEPETYVLPLGLATGERISEVRSRSPERVLAEVRMWGRNGKGEGLIYDAVGDARFDSRLLDLIERQRRVRGWQGEISGSPTSAYRKLRGPKGTSCESRALKAEQSNSSIAYGDRLILKLYRRLDAGTNPELDMGRFLTERVSFPHTPPLAGWLDYRAKLQEPRTLAILQAFAPNQGDAWEYTRTELKRYFERAVTKKDLAVSTSIQPLTEMVAEAELDPVVDTLVGAYLEAARLMGRRIAELHLALAAASDDPEFAPQPFSALDQRSSYQSMRNLTGRIFRLLHSQLSALPEDARKPAQKLLSYQDKITQCFDAFLHCRISVVRMRCHGDLHLGQMLNTGKDFIIIDFEGEPDRQLAERRSKRSALQDVTGMLRSFHYAALSCLLEELQSGALGGNDFATMEPWATLWQKWSSWAFLKAYLGTAGEAPFVPRSREELRVLLNAFLMEKAVYEVGYELNNRPAWLRLPLHGIEQILAEAGRGI